MCRLEPARTGTMFSDGCWGLSPHITDCNQLQVSIFPQFPSMPLDFAFSPHCKFSPLTDTLDNQHGSRAGQFVRLESALARTRTHTPTIGTNQTPQYCPHAQTSGGRLPGPSMKVCQYP